MTELLSGPPGPVQRHPPDTKQRDVTISQLDKAIYRSGQDADICELGAPDVERLEVPTAERHELAVRRTRSSALGQAVSS